MALTPNSPNSPDDKNARVQAAQEDSLLREVDEAVRNDDLAAFLKSYGIPLVAIITLGLASFGGYLWWSSHSEAKLEKTSEDLVKMLDQLEAGNINTAKTALGPLLGDDSPGAQAVAKLTQAGIALREKNLAEATRLYDEIANDAGAPEVLRHAALIRSVGANFDTLAPQVVIDRLKPLATPGNPYFGSAGEMVAMAYLEKGDEDLAGALLSEMSKDDKVPETLRSRARQMAGVLGVDAIEDVDAAVERMTDGGAGAAE